MTSDFGPGGRLVLRAAVRERQAPRPLLVPLIERQSAAIVGASPEQFDADAEVATRALRAAANLYPVDALTIGADADWLARAVGEARSDDGAARAPDQVFPDSVAATPSVERIRVVISRLRPVLGDRVGLVVVVPDAERMLAHLANQVEDVEWASQVLLAVVRSIAGVEPDAVFVRGYAAFRSSGFDALLELLESVAAHFDIGIVPIGPPAHGVAVLAEAVLRDEGDAAVPDDRATWLITTDAPLLDSASPAIVRSALSTIRTNVGGLV